jgi:hypothetical protein
MKSVICGKIYETSGHHVKQSKQDTESQVSDVLSHMWKL